MSERIQFTETQRDGFEELVNIGMGRAGDALARLLGVFVELRAPSIRFVLSENIGRELEDLIDAETISGVRQGFFAGSPGGALHGEAIMIFSTEGFTELTSLLAYESELSDRGKRELLLDLSNLLNGACLNGIADQLEEWLDYSAPFIIGQGIPIYELLDEEHLTWEYALVLKVNYRVENKSFTCDLLLLMPEKAVAAVAGKIDQMLEKLE